jgi:hypothetical protein
MIYIIYRVNKCFQAAAIYVVMNHMMSMEPVKFVFIVRPLIINVYIYLFKYLNL